ncbi:MAG TPA: O-antigen ligase family protein [Bryobacteraceae bacterium]
MYPRVAVPLIPESQAAVSYIDTPIRRLGVATLCLFLLFAYGRVLDLKAAGLHIPLALSLFALFCAALSGGIPRALSSRIGILLTALTVWMILCVPFAYWRSNALDMVKDHWARSFLLYVLLASLLGSLKDCRRAMTALAWGTIMVTGLALYFRQTVRGRIIVPNTALTNSNDIAQVLLMCVPFLVLLTLRGNNLVMRVFAALCVPPVFVVILKTGSRGALIAIAISGLLLFWHAPMTGKIKLAVLGVGAMVVFAFFLPSTVRSRYLTIFGGGTSSVPDESDEESAIASAHERKALLMQAVKISAKRPVFGVGPGNFQAYAALDSAESRQRARWRVTHNTYLQLSSEIGVLGAALFLAVMVYCFRQLSLVMKACKNRPDAIPLSHTAFALRYSLLTYAITAFFSSTAYEILFPTIAGLCAALISAAQDELRSAPAPLPVVAIPVRRQTRLMLAPTAGSVSS